MSEQVQRPVIEIGRMVYFKSNGVTHTGHVVSCDNDTLALTNIETVTDEGNFPLGLNIIFVDRRNPDIFTGPKQSWFEEDFTGLSNPKQEVVTPSE